MKIEDFKNGDKNILFVTSRKYGNGLNINAASDIIFCERVTNQIIKNIVGTNYRISRSNPLKLHYLFRHWFLLSIPKMVLNDCFRSIFRLL